MRAAGETEEQYLATERLVREVGFDRVNTAAYSPRPNTPAAEWDNQVRLEQHSVALVEFNGIGLCWLFTG
jgi:tRNA A37 methylthiotransferase MiaB